MRNLNLFLLPILIFFNSAFLFSQDATFKVTGITGVAFIEKADKSLRVFRGSEIHSEYKLRTSSDSQAEITIAKNGDKIGNITVNENTILLVNPPIYKNASSKISLSLLEGYIKVNIQKDIGNIVEIHTANTSAIVRGTEFEVAFAENGSSIVLLSEGSVDIVTDDDEKILSPKQAYIKTMDEESKIIKQNVESDPRVFLNRGEEISRANSMSTIENLINAMENISQEEVAYVSPLNNEAYNDKYINDMEMKRYRMLAANEGYYNTIIKLINLEPDKKIEMTAYARKSLALYGANQRAINKMNSAIIKNREKFDKIRKDFDVKIGASVPNQ
mgnify:CR=1 FL=1